MSNSDGNGYMATPRSARQDKKDSKLAPTQSSSTAGKNNGKSSVPQDTPDDSKKGKEETEVRGPEVAEAPAKSKAGGNTSIENRKDTKNGVWKVASKISSGIKSSLKKLTK